MFDDYATVTQLMRNLELPCPRCGTVNSIPPSERIADRKCSDCHGFLGGFATAAGGITPAAPRRKIWLKAAAAPAWQDADGTAERPAAARWPLWFKLAVPLFAAALCVPLFMLLAKKNRVIDEPDPSSGTGVSDAKAAAAAPKTPYPQTLDSIWKYAAIAVAQKAISARTVDDLLPLLHLDGIPEELVRKYYTDEASGTLPIGTEIMKVQIPDQDYGEALVLIQYLDVVERVSALLVVERDGRRLVDWASMVALGEMKLSDFLSRRPTTPVQMRLRARRADVYQPPYEDTTRWSCVLLTDPTEVYRIYAYLDRKHPNAWRIDAELPAPRLIAEENIPLPVNCRLAFTRTDAPKDMVEMTDLMSMSWFETKSMQKGAASQGSAAPVPATPPAR